MVINEILHYQTCGCTNDASDEFVELYFTQAADVSGWVVSDGNQADGDTDGTAGTYLVSNDPNGTKDAVPPATAQFYAGASRYMLNNLGDDVWLFDVSMKLVDYVAYGSDNAINNQSNLPTGAWDGNNAPATASAGQSLALDPNGVDTNSGNDWEPSGSGSTQDNDATTCGGTERATTVGTDNNNPVPVELFHFSVE